MAGSKEGNSNHKSKWTLLSLACLSGACLYLGMNGIDASEENFNVAQMYGSNFRRLSNEQQPTKERIMEEMVFKPVDDVWEHTVLHPQYYQLPPIQRHGPGDETTFLIGIFSNILSTGEKRKRQRIRETYLGNGNDPRICSLQDHMAHVDQGEPCECKILYTFVVGGNILGSDEHFRSAEPLIMDTISEKEVKAVNKHGSVESDIVYLNVRENIDQGKGPTWFKYAATLTEKYQIDYIAKTEQHVMVSMPHLIDYIITDLPPYPYNARMFGGNFIFNQWWFAESSFYFLSSDMAKYISSDDLNRQDYRDQIKDKKANIPQDYEISKFVWSHPYPVKMIFMAHRNLWIQALHEDDDWMQVWKTYDGVPPPSRTIESAQPLDIAPHIWEQNYKPKLMGGTSTMGTFTDHAETTQP